VEADLAECRTLYPNQNDDVLYVDGVPCRLSTARSIEAEGIAEAIVVINRGIELLHEADKLGQWDGVRSFLEYWDEVTYSHG